MTDHTAALRDAAELIDVLTSNLSADHPFRVKAAEQAKSMVARLYALATQPQQPAGWMPIETAPKDGKDVMVYTNGLTRLSFYDAARGGIWSCWPGRERLEPTHWMPLPSPPGAHPSQQEDDGTVWWWNGITEPTAPDDESGEDWKYPSFMLQRDGEHTIRLSQQEDDALDAKRYRWLRDKWGYIEDEYDGYDQDKMLRIYKADEDHGWDVDPESLDAAIDAAMSDGAGEGGKNG